MMANPILDARMYARITGIAVAAVAVLGIIMNLATENGTLVANFLEFDWVHNILHVVLAAAALYVGFMAPANLCTLFAKVLGPVYLALGVVGFIPDVLSFATIGLEIGENLIHVVLGAWGIGAGFFGTTTGTPTPTNPPTTKTTPPRRA